MYPGGSVQQLWFILPKNHYCRTGELLAIAAQNPVGLYADTGQNVGIEDYRAFNDIRRSTVYANSRGLDT